MGETNVDANQLAEALGKLSTTQQVVGTHTVNSSAFIIVAIIMFIVFFGIIFWVIKTMMNSQQQQVEQNRQMFDRLMNSDVNKEITAALNGFREVVQDVTVYLQKVSSGIDEAAKLELNSAQTQIVFKNCIKGGDHEIFRKIATLVASNHIEEKDRIHRRVKEIVESEFESIETILLHFKYNGVRLKEYFCTDLFERKIQVLLEFIYSQRTDSERRVILYEEFNIIYIDTLNQINNQLDKNK